MSSYFIRSFLALQLLGLITSVSANADSFYSIENHTEIELKDKLKFTSCDSSINYRNIQQLWPGLNQVQRGDLKNYNCYWGKITITNNTAEERWVMSLGALQMQYMEVFLFDGEILSEHFETGRFVSPANKPIAQGNKPVVPLTIARGDTVVVFLNFEYYRDVLDTENVGLRLIPSKAFYDQITHDQAFIAFILGTYLILIFGALALFIATKEKLYLYYLLYILIGAIFITAYDGQFAEYLLEDHPEWFRYFWVLGCAAPTIYLLFMREFLTLSFTLKAFDRIVKVVIALSFVALIAAFVLTHIGQNYDDGSYVIHYMIMGQMAFMLISQFVLLPKILKDYRVMFFVAGSFCYLSTSIYSEISGFGTSAGIGAAALIEGLIFAAGMGYRLLIQNQNKQQLLEQEVRDRTAELSSRNATIEEQVKRNEVLIKEINHRVKNNLQMISSLLNMQQRRLKGTQAKEAMDDMQSRVLSLGLIHEHLQTHEALTEIKTEEFIPDLLKMLKKTWNTDSTLEFKTELAVRHMDVENLIPIGIILNELITNCMKYAFKDQPNPVIEVRLSERENVFSILVSDNGRHKDLNFEEGFGHTIIQSMLQNRGSIHCEMKSDGFKAEVLIPKN